MRSRSVVAGCFLLGGLAAAAPAALSPGGHGTAVDQATGLVWVADWGHAVHSGFAPRVVMGRARALRFVAAMNRGRVENFARTDWRLATTREVRELVRRHGPITLDTGEVISDGRVARLRPLRAVAFVVAGATVPTELAEAAMLATNSVHLNKSVAVTGDVVVNDASPGPTLAAGFELKLDKQVSVAGDVKADSLRVDSQAAVTGTAFYNTLSNLGTLGGQSTPLTLPVFPLLPPFETALLRPAAPDVLVASGEVLTIAAGDYDVVEIAQGGTLVFSGGVYNLRTLRTVNTGSCSTPCRSLHFQAPSDLRIAERWDSGDNSVIGPGPGSSAEPSDLIVYVGGINGADGALGALPPAVRIGKQSAVGANFYAPNGTFHLERDNALTGAILARDVEVDQNSTVAADSFFTNRSPVAFPDNVFTSGATPLVITLRGSDPEGEDLTFAIVTAPQFGTLGTIVEQDPPTQPPRGELRVIRAAAASESTALVTYTPDSSADVSDSFTFQVTDPPGASGSAVVRINPPPAPDAPPPPPPTTVVADDVADETLRDTAFTVNLTGDAPDEVGLTFGVVAGSGPTNGALGPLVQGTEVPQRTASVVYTPNAGFLGADGFQFEACGTIDSALVCDTGAVAIQVVEPPSEPGELAPDQSVETFEDLPLQINLSGSQAATGASRLVSIRGQAAFLDGAEIGGNVADADDDGFGDNHNALPGSSPVFVSAGVGSEGGPGSNGTVRIHIEWDITGLAGATNLESAAVLLHTHRGTTDSLDTAFFHVGTDGNGTLEDSDFESVAEPVAGAVMQVPPAESMPVGTDGTFSFDVLSELQSDIDTGRSFFSVQGRVDESLTSGRGLEVRSTASGNVSSFLEPQLSITTPGVVAPATFEILSLPANGTLKDSEGQVIEVEMALPSSLLSYTPNAGFVGINTFTFQATFGETIDTGVVTIQVLAGSCATNPDACDDGRQPADMKSTAGMKGTRP